MTWKSSNGAASPKSGGASSSRYGPDPALQRLVRLVAEEGGVHAFIHRATADQGVVEEARALTRMLLGGQDIPEPCRQLCQRLGVDESLLRARLWAARETAPLFDMPRFAAKMEAAFDAMWDRWQRGLPAEGFSIPER